MALAPPFLIRSIPSGSTSTTTYIRDIQINYQSIGSGGGIRQVQAGTVDFGASDGPMTDEQIAAVQGQGAARSDRSRRGGSCLQHSRRQRRSEVHARHPGRNIYWARSPSGTIHAITKVNPGINFPDQNITVVHRSDGSGTTYIFTDYLSKVSSDWKSTVGKGTSVKWPVGIGGKGNEGVAGIDSPACPAPSATSN